MQNAVAPITTRLDCIAAINTYYILCYEPSDMLIQMTAMKCIKPFHFTFMECVNNIYLCICLLVPVI